MCILVGRDDGVRHVLDEVCEVADALLGLLAARDVLERPDTLVVFPLSYVHLPLHAPSAGSLAG